MRQIYTTENFDKNKYNDVYNMSTKINKCAINTTFVILGSLAISLSDITYIEFDDNKKYQLSIYVPYERNNKNFYSINNIKIEDFKESEEIKKEWFNFIGDIFCGAFAEKGELI